MNVALCRGVVVAAFTLALSLPTWGADAVNRGKATTPVAAVDLFDGIKSGDVDVKLIPKDATEGMLTIKNQTGQPLTIKLPEAFAAVPVLAQRRGGAAGGGGGMGGMGGGGMGGMGGGQGMGGGMMGGGMGGMGGGMGGMGGGGMFNIAPEKVTKIKFVAVCLDHGKKDPTPNMPYQIIPIESYAKSAQVSEVIKMLVRGEIDQHSAQAAAWHLQNGLSWEELTKKIGAKHLNGSVEAYFTMTNLERALMATRITKERAEKLPEQALFSKSATPALTPYRSPAAESLSQP